MVVGETDWGWRDFNRGSRAALGCGWFLAEKAGAPQDSPANRKNATPEKPGKDHCFIKDTINLSLPPIVAELTYNHSCHGCELL